MTTQDTVIYFLMAEFEAGTHVPFLELVLIIQQ
jgi:hypothetical protein